MSLAKFVEEMKAARTFIRKARDWRRTAEGSVHPLPPFTSQDAEAVLEQLDVPVVEPLREVFPFDPVRLVKLVLSQHQTAYAKFHCGEGRKVIESNDMAIGYAAVELEKALRAALAQSTAVGAGASQVPTKVGDKFIAYNGKSGFLCQALSQLDDLDSQDSAPSKEGAGRGEE